MCHQLIGAALSRTEPVLAQFARISMMSQALRTLILYKRHTPQCTVHKSRIPRKNRRFYFECSCPIYIKGRTPAGDLVPKQSTGFSDLKKTEALRDSLSDEGATAFVGRRFSTRLE